MKYSKKEVINWFENGKKINATHMIIALDKADCMYYNRYVKDKENVDQIIKKVIGFNSYGNTIIDSVYNYDLDFEMQYNEGKPMHKEPSIRNMTLYQKALNYATKMHEGQIRKGKKVIPYIEHPIEVSELVEKYMKNDNELEIYKAAAILHDTLEDTNATYEEEKMLFGKKVADIVSSVTNNKEEKDKLGKDLYLSRKMNKMDDKTLLLKLCDRYSNIIHLKNVDDEFNEKYRNETIYIINYLLLNRKLNDKHLRIINDIMNILRIVSINKIIILPSKKLELLNK